MNMSNQPLIDKPVSGVRKFGKPRKVGVNNLDDDEIHSNEKTSDGLQGQDSSPLVGDPVEQQSKSSKLKQIGDATNKKLRPQGSSRRPFTLLRKLYELTRSFPIQVVMILIVLCDVIFLIYEFASGLTTFESVTLFTSLSFVLELMIFWGYEGKRAFFLYERYWLYVEVAIVSLSFVVEYSEFVIHHHAPQSDLDGGRLRYLRAARFVRVFIIWKTRLRHFKSALRQLVSADRRRYQLGGYDLDLTYVCSNIVAMSWPSEGKESFYRNQIDNVANFLDESHGESSYHIFNLCSERAYDESKFHNQVTRYKMDDHNPCEVLMMLDFAKDLTRYMGEDPMNNVGVVHCKGGKGRTGTMICAYLLYAKLDPDANDALQHFGEARTSAAARKFQGVESPSQDRYVRYFERLLDMPKMQPPKRWCKITTLKLSGVPVAYWELAKLWYVVIQNPTARSAERTNHYCSNPTVSFDPVLPDNPYGRSKKVKMGSGRSAGSMGSNTPSDESNPAFVAEDGDDDWLTVGGCQPFSGNMVVYVNGSSHPMDVETFNQKYPAHDPATKNLRVDVGFNTSSIPPVVDDVHIKFFHNVDNPNPLSAPLQIWFHTGFEDNSLNLARKDLDGPHKDKKHKKWTHHSQVDITLLTVDEPSLK